MTPKTRGGGSETRQSEREAKKKKEAEEKKKRDVARKKRNAARKNKTAVEEKSAATKKRKQGGGYDCASSSNPTKRARNREKDTTSPPDHEPEPETVEAPLQQPVTSHSRSSTKNPSHRVEENDEEIGSSNRDASTPQPVINEDNEGRIPERTVEPDMTRTPEAESNIRDSRTTPEAIPTVRNISV
ncbi:hypothetical protein Bca52824_025217 [Brassica carinata]|uniref:Uncharacterized protein n=1 Tax=Brassica carinata TaxID=52824 RepID=A0A8X8AVI5_BRACI|nr:hypothetical protein Bca52824_025217 [Brassica carinata]